jgi:hypothetical protein
MVVMSSRSRQDGAFVVLKSDRSWRHRSLEVSYDSALP